MFLAELKFPTSICLRVTRRCNAACSFCQAPNISQAVLTVEEIEGIGIALRKRNLATIKLSGGEPTVRDDLPQIIEVFGHQGIKPVVITNGISVHDSVYATLKAVDGEFKFSIHRPCLDNDLILRVPSFSQILANIKTARSRSIPFSINTVITPTTTDIIPEMINFAIEQRARKISFIPVVPRGRARTQAEFEFDRRQVAAVRSTVSEISRVFKKHIDVRCIDIRAHDYWIVENDGSLWIEKACEDADILVCQKDELINL